MTLRPAPPSLAIEPSGDPVFVPAPELVDWLRLAFIDPLSRLYNPDHDHLAHAHIGALWTNVPNGRHGMTILATAQPGEPVAMGKWARAKAEAQLIGWFDDVPDFLLTFYAPYAATCADAEFCALVEHELYHCAQDRDLYGAPKFTKGGKPVFTMRGHDVEEFVGVVRRYGADAAGVRAMVDAASRKPEVAPVHIAQACGTCQLRAA